MDAVKHCEMSGARAVELWPPSCAPDCRPPDPREQQENRGKSSNHKLGDQG